jgi:hypothetical protein
MWLKLSNFRIIILLGVLFLWAAREIYLCSDIEVSVGSFHDSPTAICMSRREAKRLEYFFQQIIIKEPFAYTLAGTKPASIYGFENRFTILSPSNVRFVLGWKTFEKYKRYFDSEKIDCWVEKNWIEAGAKDLLVIVDRGKLNEIFLNNTNFKQNPQILTSRPLFAKGLQKHDALIGIALGYGKKNAWLYHNKFYDYANWTLEQKLDVSNKLPLIWDREVIEKQAKKIWFKSLMFQSLTAEDIGIPSFVGDPFSEESLQLKQDYLLARKKIIQYYKNRNFLEASLNLYKYGFLILNLTSSCCHLDDPD